MHPLALLRVLLLPISVALCSCWSCEPHTLRTTRQVAEKGWHESTPMEFFFTIHDTTVSYRLSVEVQSSSRYPYHNLYLAGALQEAAHCETLHEQQQEHLLYHPTDGHPIGKVRQDIVVHQLIFLDKHLFGQPGEYLISVRHRMRDKWLVGVVSVGILLTKAEE